MYSFTSKKRLIIGGTLLVTLIAAISLYRSSPFSLLNNLGDKNNQPAETSNLSVEMVATNLNVPWSLAFAGEQQLFFTERGNTLRLIENGQLRSDPIARVDSAAAGEGGLLGMAVHPNFRENGYLYLYYTHSLDTQLFNKVVRYRFRDYNLVDPKTILDLIPAGQVHDGGRIKFGPDDKLYVTTGDSGKPDLAQKLDSLAGKILRLNDEGSVPSDNPFPNSPVYSYGHRNPQGLAWHSQTKQLYATEHGQQAHDEVNLIRPGKNYGWPAIEGSETKENLVAPFTESGANTWAPAGAAFYGSAKLPREWHNQFIFTGLRSKSLWRLNVKDKKIESLFNNEYGRLRDVIAGPDGYLYFATSNQDGRGDPAANDDRILRIVPK